MSTQKRTRCSHCGDEYYYYLSGYNPAYNSSKRCIECQKIYEKAVTEAFNDIPKKFESRDVLVEQTQFSSVTKDDIKRWLEALEEKRKTALVAQRVGFPMFDIGGNKGTLTTAFINALDGSFRGREFRYEYWTSEGFDTMKIYVEMEYDIPNERFTGNPWP